MISIIGAGRVGSALGFLISATALDDVILIDRKKPTAVGKALDVTNSISHDSSVTITGTDNFESMKSSEVIVITSSRGRIIKEKTDALIENVSMIKEISAQIKKYGDDAKIVVVTNPLDVITYYTLKETGFSRESVLGMGSSLDSSRFRYLLSLEIGTSQSSIEGMVMGEHGPSMVPLFSSAKCKGDYVSNLLDEKQMRFIKAELKDYANRLRMLKTPSVFGGAKNSYDIVKAIINDEKLSVPASVLLEGEYGISDVCLGVPVKIGRNGMESVIEIELGKTEADLLKHSAQVIKDNIKNSRELKLIP